MVKTSVVMAACPEEKVLTAPSRSWVVVAVGGRVREAEPSLGPQATFWTVPSLGSASAAGSKHVRGSLRELTTQSPGGNLRKSHCPSASHMAGLAAQVSFEDDFKGLASSRPQLTLLFERGENDPSAPTTLGRRTYKTDSFRNDNSQARGRLAPGLLGSPGASAFVYISLLFNRERRRLGQTVWVAFKFKQKRRSKSNCSQLTINNR